MGVGTEMWLPLVSEHKTARGGTLAGGGGGGRGQGANGAQLIVEVTDGAGNVRLEVIARDSVTLGRGFGNRLILTDPFVSPRHARLYRNGETWLVEDLGSRNGVSYRPPGRRARRREVTVATALESGGELTVGRTRLRVFTPSHAVAEARPLLRHSLATLPQRRPWTAVLLALLAVVVGGLPFFFEDWGSDGLEAALGAVLGVGLLVGSWALSFALLGRLLRRGAHFFSHAFVAALLGVPLAMTWMVHEARSFLLDPSASWRWAVAVWLGIVLLLGLRASLRRATEYSWRWRVLTILVCVGFTFMLGLDDDIESSGGPHLEERLLPLPESTLMGQELDEFYDGVPARLFPIPSPGLGKITGAKGDDGDAGEELVTATAP